MKESYGGASDLSLVHVGGESEERLGIDIEPRNAERIVNRNPGTRVPVYLDMYDAATIVKIDDLVHQYMVDSKNFTSAAMPRCNGFPKA